MLQVINQFRATVYGKETDTQVVFQIIDFLHDAMQTNEYNVFFDDEQNPQINMAEFMGDLMDSIDRCYYKFQNFNQSDLESELEAWISGCEKFTDLAFSIHDSDWYFVHINEKIKNGEYN